MGRERTTANNKEAATKSEAFIAQDEQDDLRGRGWHGNPEGHAEAGRKGGQSVSQNRAHMAAIGRRGGQSVSQNRNHMAEIGRKGGQSRGTKLEGETSNNRQTNAASGRKRSPKTAD